jgi:hypothetical protein
VKVQALPRARESAPWEVTTCYYIYVNTYVLFTKDSPQERDVDHFLGRLERFKVPAEKIEADSPKGISLTETYDLRSRPAAVLLRADGSAVERWQGQLPTPEDVSYLAHQ